MQLASRPFSDSKKIGRLIRRVFFCIWPVGAVTLNQLELLQIFFSLLSRECKIKEGALSFCRLYTYFSIKVIDDFFYDRQPYAGAAHEPNRILIQNSALKSFIKSKSLIPNS